jgi:uncharacterized membrane protein (UPF0182 family)
MVQGLEHLHNFLRWVVLLFGLLVILRSMRGMRGDKEFTGGDRKMALMLLITVDVQLLLGLALYYLKGWLDVLTSGADIMANKVNRFFTVEHSIGMLLAIILIHIAYSKAKSSTISDTNKFRKLFWFTLIAFIIIIMTIPWPFRGEQIGQPLFPGM